MTKVQAKIIVYKHVIGFLKQLPTSVYGDEGMSAADKQAVHDAVAGFEKDLQDFVNFHEKKPSQIGIDEKKPYQIGIDLGV